VAVHPYCLAGLPRLAVLDLSHDLKGAAAMTDPNDTTDVPADDEIAAEDLDAVSGGVRTVSVGSNSTIMGEAH
jgi:hypothetical protein